ncbi:MAG: metallophosphoesterase [Spirochaetia bacterium]|nr:metallophosphoesterase [Spirochaetia bacterium]
MKIPQYFFFLIFIILVLGSGYTYLKKRLVEKFNISKTKHKIFSRLILALFIMVILSFPFRIIFGALLDWYDRIAFASLGIISFLFTYTLIRDLGELLFFFYKKIPKSANQKKPEDSQEFIKRKEFIYKSINYSILGLSGLSFSYGFIKSQINPKVVQVNVPIQNLPVEFDNFKICQISDLHIGALLKGDFTENVVSIINSLNADIVALTGDAVDGSVAALKKDTEPLSDIKTKYGKFFATGNHEYYSGVDEWMKEFDRLKFTVLLNENRAIQKNNSKIFIAGVADPHGERFSKFHKSSPLKAAKGIKENDISILLAHQPKSIYEASKANFNLQLTGHTHGGQFFPWIYIAQMVHPYIAGLHKHENTFIYVNSGTGYWGPPVRMGTDSEITLLTLKRVV